MGRQRSGSPSDDEGGFVAGRPGVVTLKGRESGKPLGVGGQCRKHQTDPIPPSVS